MAIYVPHSKIVIAGLSYVQPVVDVSYLQIKVTAEVSMPDVLAVDIVTPADELVFAFTKSLSDTALIPDAVAIALSTGAADTISEADDLRKSTHKRLVDAITEADIAIFGTAKRLMDAVTAPDAAHRATSKSLADVYSGAVDTITGKSVGKALTDSLTMVDIVDIEYWLDKHLADTQPVVEQLVYVFSKSGIADIIEEPVDAAALSTDKALADVYSGAVDAITGKSTEKSLSDAITLSDTAEAYKLYIRAFSDEFSTPDAYAELFVSGVTADSSTAADAYNHALTKNFFESSVLIDNMDGDIQYNFIKLVGELLAASDAKVVDFAANKSDNVTSSDSGVLSMQDYCDITYFLEDYVGISRTF